MLVVLRRAAGRGDAFPANTLGQASPHGLVSSRLVLRPHIQENLRLDHASCVEVFEQGLCHLSVVFTSGFLLFILVLQVYAISPPV